jgi:hypothetical protein
MKNAHLFLLLFKQVKEKDILISVPQYEATVSHMLTNMQAN